MTTATIGSRFQVVIPAKERKQLALKAHQKVRGQKVRGQTFCGVGGLA